MIVFLVLLLVGSNAFQIVHEPISTRAASLFMAVELKPEPEGGDEVTAISTMAGSRLKNMVRRYPNEAEEGSEI